MVMFRTTAGHVYNFNTVWIKSTILIFVHMPQQSFLLLSNMVDSYRLKEARWMNISRTDYINCFIISCVFKCFRPIKTFGARQVFLQQVLQHRRWRWHEQTPGRGERKWHHCSKRTQRGGCATACVEDRDLNRKKFSTRRTHRLHSFWYPGRYVMFRCWS